MFYRRERQFNMVSLAEELIGATKDYSVASST